MKNKKLLILILLVVCVWGVIGFKVYQQLSHDSVMPAVKRSQAIAVEEQEEHYALSFSYEDPFLKKLYKPKVLQQTIRKQTAFIIPKVEAPVIIINWELIKYLGLVYNKTRKNKMAAIALDDKDYFIKEGEIVEGFLIEEIHPDSIKVNYSGSIKYITKK